MVEIIKRGTKQTCTCKECGCYFSYEVEDIEVENKPLLTWVESIVCPQCNKKIILS